MTKRVIWCGPSLIVGRFVCELAVASFACAGECSSENTAAVATAPAVRCKNWRLVVATGAGAG